MPDFGFDDWMDAQLRNVPVPRDLHARLRSALPPQDSSDPGVKYPADAELDALIKNVEVPEGMHRRLRRIPRGRLLTMAWRDASRSAWAAAAAVLLLAGAGTFVALRPVPHPQVATAVPQQAAPPTRQQRQSNIETPRQERTTVPDRTPKAAPTRQTPITVALGDQSNSPSSRLVRNVSDVGAALRKAIEAQQAARMALGASDQLEPLPSLETLESPHWPGIAPPRVRGYDLLFQLRHREHPFVSTSGEKALMSSPLPLTFSTVSYDRAQAELAAGRVPNAADIRIEDFLAAQQYALPPAPAHGLAIHAAGCPTPGGDAGKHLLQIAVQAADIPQLQRPPARLIAVVDTSSAMSQGARAKLVVRALARLSDDLLETDRLTLIGFSDTPRVLLDNVNREQLAILGASGGVEPSGGTANLLAAIQSAASAVSELPPEENCRVVFITGSGGLWGQERGVAHEALASITARGFRWHLVQLSVRPVESDWHELAQAARGRASVATSADQLSALCLETLTGRPVQVAQAVSARVTFNPKTVAGYRLLGHEAHTLTGTPGTPLTVDLHAGQVGTGMYEIWLKPDVQGDLGIIEVNWRHPTAGVPQRRVQPIRRADLVANFAEAPAWLQQGIVAARTAEHLRGSYFVPNTRRLALMLDLASRAGEDASQAPEFRALVRLIQHADRLR
jgi:Ca-activated chloride channel family protein